MGAAMAIVILWALLLAVPPARADQIAFADPPMPVTEGLPRDTLPNIQASTIGPNAPLDRKSGYEPLFPSKIQDTLGKTARLSSESRVGFQWAALNGQRPSLEYRFTDNQKMQFRGSRHGVRVVAIWTF